MAFGQWTCEMCEYDSRKLGEDCCCMGTAAVASLLELATISCRPPLFPVRDYLGALISSGAPAGTG